MSEQKNRTVLVAGASGATGRLLVKQLLDGGHRVRVVVRSRERFTYSDHENISVTEASILDLNKDELVQLVAGCDAVACCLGHNISLKGLYGKPRKLVRDATRNLCEAIESASAGEPVKFVLMNTSGNRNKDLNEPRGMGGRIVIGILRAILPPQPDNEQAAEHLRTNIGKDHDKIQWVAVRPDSLIDQEEVSEYTPVPSPLRDPIFNAGKTSRINVAHFMATLVTDEETWNMWKGQMPVVYNSESVVTPQGIS